MITLYNLEACGLLKVQQSNRPFTVIRRTLNLTVDDVNEIHPTDISYVHSIYAPLSVRLIQWAAKPGWKSILDVLNLIPGPLVQEKQPLPINLRRRSTFRLIVVYFSFIFIYILLSCGVNLLGNSGNSIHSSLDETKLTLVFFIGGCTYAEISALRFLSRMDDGKLS
jgi:hypothetical protein